MRQNDSKIPESHCENFTVILSDLRQSNIKRTETSINIDKNYIGGLLKKLFVRTGNREQGTGKSFSYLNILKLSSVKLKNPPVLRLPKPISCTS